jgi:SAM-dependent methyltransferase
MAENPGAYWNNEAGPRWVRSQIQLDRMLEAVSGHLLAATAARTGERVIDVGCGCGATTLDLGQQVGPTGGVLGIDIAERMIEHARVRMPPVVKHVEFLVADAATHAFDAGSSSLITSRLGVMFFPDPVLAFTNLRHALAEDGRLVFCCWQGEEHNHWIRQVLEAFPEVQAPDYPGGDVPGPFSLSSPGRVRQILEDAGFRAVELDAVSESLYLGENLDEVEHLYTQIGPLARAFGQADDTQRVAMRGRLRAFLADRFGEGELELPSASWIVSARAQP